MIIHRWVTHGEPGGLCSFKPNFLRIGGLVNSTEEVCEEFNDFFLLQCFQEKELRTFRLLGICFAVVKRIC